MTHKFPIMSDSKHGDLPARSHAPIPWVVAERAYADYSRRYGTEQTLERLAERGGFGCREMDTHAPGWEEECTAVAILEARVEVLEAEKLALDTCWRCKVTLEKVGPPESRVPRCTECPEPESMDEVDQSGKGGS